MFSFMSKYSKTQAPPLEMTTASSSLLIRHEKNNANKIVIPEDSWRYLAEWSLVS